MSDMIFIKSQTQINAPQIGRPRIFAEGAEFPPKALNFGRRRRFEVLIRNRCLDPFLRSKLEIQCRIARPLPEVEIV